MNSCRSDIISMRILFNDIISVCVKNRNIIIRLFYDSIWLLISYNMLKFECR